MGMSVVLVNQVGCTVNLRSVDPQSGKYGPAFCTMTNGSNCTATQDFIAVVADGTGRYDAGDPFDAWWGDDSWRTAHETLVLKQDPSKPTYIDYVKPSQLGEHSEQAANITYRHQIVTSPGDHCLEITVPGGDDSPFWKAEGWKYSAPVRPEWVSGQCDKTKWKSHDDETDGYDGYTAAKNSPYGAVVLIKYGLEGTNMPWLRVNPALRASSQVASVSPSSMSVVLVNQVGCTVNLRSVDPQSGQYGPAFCTMTNGSNCTATQDFIAVVADGTGRYDAGDPFDAWWGDDSWKTAHETLVLKQDPSKPTYIDYVKPSQLGEHSEQAANITYRHQIVTSPGDHCLEITVPGGDDSPFWRAEGWKYSAPVRPEWVSGQCDKTKWRSHDDETDSYDGYTAARNSPYGAVVLIKY